MRKTAILFVATFFAFACKKDNAVKQDPPPIDPGPVQTYKPHTMITESYSPDRVPGSIFTNTTFSYDGQNRLTHRFDNGNPKVNYYFTYTGENTYAAEYVAEDTIVTWREFGMLVNGKLDSLLIISRYDITDTTGSRKYVYNGQGKLKSEIYYQKSGTEMVPSYYYNYEYDEKGNMSKYTTPNDSARYFYDTKKPNTLAPIMPYQETNPYLVSKMIYYPYGQPSQTIDHHYGFDVVGKVITDTSEFRSYGRLLIYTYTY